jgi:hypothetical protein
MTSLKAINRLELRRPANHGSFSQTQRKKAEIVEPLARPVHDGPAGIWKRFLAVLDSVIHTWAAQAEALADWTHFCLRSDLSRSGGLQHGTQCCHEGHGLYIGDGSEFKPINIGFVRDRAKVTSDVISC